MQLSLYTWIIILPPSSAWSAGQDRQVALIHSWFCSVGRRCWSSVSSSNVICCCYEAEGGCNEDLAMFDGLLQSGGRVGPCARILLLLLEFRRTPLQLLPQELIDSWALPSPEFREKETGRGRERKGFACLPADPYGRGGDPARVGWSRGWSDRTTQHFLSPPGMQFMPTDDCHSPRHPSRIHLFVISRVLTEGRAGSQRNSKVFRVERRCWQRKKLPTAFGPMEMVVFVTHFQLTVAIIRTLHPHLSVWKVAQNTVRFI